MVQVLSATFTTLPPEEVFYAKIKGPIGPLLAGLTKKGEICRLAFLNEKTQTETLAKWKKSWSETTFAKAPEKLANKAQAAFGEKAKDVKVLLTGTAFQHKVWATLLEIPEGFLISYAALAIRSGEPKASRAVGSAVGANPVPLLVPCHRVIANDGSLGGFSAGIAIKKKLLKAETPGEE